MCEDYLIDNQLWVQYITQETKYFIFATWEETQNKTPVNTNDFVMAVHTLSLISMG